MHVTTGILFLRMIDERVHVALHRPIATRGVRKQYLDHLRRKDSLRGAETTEISVRLGNYSASHFEGAARIESAPCLDRAVGRCLHCLDGKVPRRLNHDTSLAADPRDDGRPILVVMAPSGLAFLAATPGLASQ